MDIQKQKTQQQQKRKLDLLSSNRYIDFKDFHKKILQYTDEKVSKITLTHANANTFSEEEYSELFRLMRYNRTIRELSIQGGSYDLDELRKALLSSNKTLNKLSLSSPESIKNLGKFIESCNGYQLQSLSLKNIELDLDLYIFEAISNISNEKLTHLSLEEMLFRNRNTKIELICRLIKNNKYLQELNLRDNDFEWNELEMILDALKRNDTLKVFKINDWDYMYTNEKIEQELEKNEVLSNIVNYINQKLPFPIHDSKFVFEKLLVFLDEYKDNLKQREKLNKLDKQRMTKMLEVDKKIFELENYSPQTRKQIQDTKQQLKELQIEKEFLSYVPHDVEEISFLEKRIQVERDRLMNKLLDSDELRKNLNMTTLTKLQKRAAKLSYDLMMSDSRQIQDNQIRLLNNEIQKINNQIEEEKERLKGNLLPVSKQIQRDKSMSYYYYQTNLKNKYTELDKILGEYHDFESEFYNDSTPRSVIKAKLEDLTKSDEDLKEIFKFRKLKKQIIGQIKRIQEQNKYIKEYNKPFQQFQKKNDPDTLKQFYTNVLGKYSATFDPYYTTEKVDEIIGKYASEKELHDALLLFFQEFREYNKHYRVAESDYSIDNFEYVMGVKVSQIIELNFLSPIFLFFILEYIELYANDLYKEIPEKYKKGKRIFEPYSFSNWNLVILNHSEKKRHKMNLHDFLTLIKDENDVYFPIFIMMMRLFKNKYIEIYDQISGYIYEIFNVSFVDDKKDIEVDIMVLNSNIGPFSENQNVSLKIEWNKHSYLDYRMNNSRGILTRLSNLKQYFFFKFDELPIELKRFSKKILDQMYRKDKKTAQFLFGQKRQQKNKRKPQQQTEGEQDMMNVQKTPQINKQRNIKPKTQYTQKPKTQKNTNHMQLQNRTQQLVKNYPLENINPKILFDKSVNLFQVVKKKEYTVEYPTSYQEKQSVTFTDPSSLTQIKRILNKLVKQGYIINHLKKFERGGMRYKNVKVDEIEFTL